MSMQYVFNNIKDQRKLFQLNGNILQLIKQLRTDQLLGDCKYM